MAQGLTIEKNSYAESCYPVPYGSSFVRYLCSCGLTKPLQRIYFCRHCFKIRCRDCASHEVDSQYCHYCLEYIPTVDAKLKKNKCSNCFFCPSCQQTLNTRANMIMIPSDKDPGQLIAKKYFFLVCFSCKWSSKDVNIPDQLTATGGWKERENPNAARIDELIAHFKVVAHQDRLEREKRTKKLTQKPIVASNAIHLLDKYGISAQLSPKVTEALRAKTHPIPLSSSSCDLTKSMIAKSSNIVSAVATSQIEPLDQAYYTNPVDLNSVTSIEQRLHQVEHQPEKSSDFSLVSQTLSVKRSLRCRECERNLSKPEFNPSSIKFKILLAAYLHVPEMKIKSDLKKIKLQPQEEFSIELTVSNPSPFKVNLSIEPMSASGATIRSIDVPIAAKLLPKEDMDLEMDLSSSAGDNVEPHSPNITFIKGNKMGFRISVTPDTATMNEGKATPIVLQLKLKHEFVNNTYLHKAGSDKRETQLETKQIDTIVHVELPLSIACNVLSVK